ncbi:MAG TPA: hypothetical protein VKB05_04100 [Pyrinomonadaceae bacterium]|nr:hypothetical protein [Pyrinomonadaceae bacterium]
MVSRSGFFVRSNTPSYISAFRHGLLAAAFIGFILVGPVFAQTTARAHSQVLGADAPFSFPETLVAGPQGSVYLLDTDLSTLFSIDTRTNKLNRICGPEKLSSPSDLAVDGKGNLWVLSALRSRISKLNRQCDVQAEITSKSLPLKIATNTLGEIIILNGRGDNLFDVYGSDGKFLRGFGKRIDYKDETTNSELSDGHLAPDRAGGFYFSFNYPPLIRHYGRQGNLIGEFKPESDVEIGPPNVSARQVGKSIAVRSTYQILVLDMTVDRQGRLYLLLSGKNKIPALTEGTRKLTILAGDGRVLKKAELEYNFHRLVAGNSRLYLLRNRKPIRLDTYAML